MLAVTAVILCPVRCSRALSFSVPLHVWPADPWQERVKVSSEPLVLTCLMAAGGAGPTVIESDTLACCTGGPGSLTLTVKFDLPTVRGTPEITPVDAFRLSPAGSDPELSDHVPPPAPPVADSRAL